MRLSAPVVPILPLRGICREFYLTPRQARYVMRKYRVPVTELPNGRRGAPTVGAHLGDVASALIVQFASNPYAK